MSLNLSQNSAVSKLIGTEYRLPEARLVYEQVKDDEFDKHYKHLLSGSRVLSDRKTSLYKGAWILVIEHHSIHDTVRKMDVTGLKD